MSGTVWPLRGELGKLTVELAERYEVNRDSQALPVSYYAFQARNAAVDDRAKREQLAPEARLRHHQQLTGPVMEDLRERLKEQIAQRLVEPNSGLDAAIEYMRLRNAIASLAARQVHAHEASLVILTRSR